MKKRARLPRLTAILAGSALGFGVGGFSSVASAFPPNAVGLPYDASVDGHDVDSLIKSTGVMLAILFIAMIVWMLWAAFVHNENHPAKYDHGNSPKAIKRTLMIAGAMFFIVDGNLFINSEIDLNKVFWNFDAPETKSNVVRIEINAHQWAWDARYAGPDGKFNTEDDIVTLNDIRIPVGAPITFQVASTDVIHSLYFPNFRVKTDAVPGMINRTWFEAKDTGEFEIGCAQHCGVNHYKMKAKLTVLSPEDFATWATEASLRGKRGWDPKDQEAHWGWEWRRRD
jgi:cytochrome c oxidase subunit 2